MSLPTENEARGWYRNREKTKPVQQVTAFDEILCTACNSCMATCNSKWGPMCVSCLSNKLKLLRSE